MPYISARMTVPLTADKEKALTAAFGKQIEIFPGNIPSCCALRIAGSGSKAGVCC